MPYPVVIKCHLRRLFTLFSSLPPSLPPPSLSPRSSSLTRLTCSCWSRPMSWRCCWRSTWTCASACSTSTAASSCTRPWTRRHGEAACRKSKGTAENRVEGYYLPLYSINTKYNMAYWCAQKIFPGVKLCLLLNATDLEKSPSFPAAIWQEGQKRSPNPLCCLAMKHLKALLFAAVFCSKVLCLMHLAL